MVAETAAGHGHQSGTTKPAEDRPVEDREKRRTSKTGSVGGDFGSRKTSVDCTPPTLSSRMMSDDNAPSSDARAALMPSSFGSASEDQLPARTDRDDSNGRKDKDKDKDKDKEHRRSFTARLSLSSRLSGVNLNLMGNGAVASLGDGSLDNDNDELEDEDGRVEVRFIY